MIRYQNITLRSYSKSLLEIRLAWSLDCNLLELSSGLESVLYLNSFCSSLILFNFVSS